MNTKGHGKEKHRQRHGSASWILNPGKRKWPPSLVPAQSEMLCLGAVHAARADSGYQSFYRLGKLWVPARMV